jgi:hypothetical protein
MKLTKKEKKALEEFVEVCKKKLVVDSCSIFCNKIICPSYSCNCDNFAILQFSPSNSDGNIKVEI